MRAGDKGSPYVVDGERITLRPVFREWVFEAFYAKFVQHVFEAMEGTPWLVEFPVYHPHLLVGRSGVLKCPQTFLDAIYRMPDGSLTLVDYKSLMQARPPNYRLEKTTYKFYCDLWELAWWNRVARNPAKRDHAAPLAGVELWGLVDGCICREYPRK